MRTQTKYIETDRNTDDDEIQQKKVVTTDNQEIDGTQKIANVVYAIVGIITGLVAIRFLLLLLGANPSNAFAEIIYNLSEPFVRPFYGLFNNSYLIGGGSRFELESIIAIAVIALLGWAIVKILTISKPQQEV